VAIVITPAPAPASAIAIAIATASSKRRCSVVAPTPPDGAPTANEAPASSSVAHASPQPPSVVPATATNVFHAPTPTSSPPNQPKGQNKRAKEKTPSPPPERKVTMLDDDGLPGPSSSHVDEVVGVMEDSTMREDKSVDWEVTSHKKIGKKTSYVICLTPYRLL
jgi:hypothetical protein